MSKYLRQILYDMRLFVGLVPSGESLLRIEGMIPMFLPPDSRRVPPSNLHLTLVFLVDYPEAEVDRLKQLLWQEVFEEGIPAFSLTPHRLRWQGGTLWLELEKDPRLEAAAERLHEVVGIPFRRPFRPHITLARTRKKYSSVLGSYRLFMGKDSLFFPEACLFQSHLRPTGAVYERLMRYPLRPLS